MRLPFDVLCVQAIVLELQCLVGAKFQKVSQPRLDTLVLECYGQGSSSHLLVSLNPVFARAHLTTRRFANPSEPPALCMSLRKYFVGRRIVAVDQLSGDRIIQLTTEEEILILELMGKHANLVLLDSHRKVLAAHKIFGPQKSVRPIQVNKLYSEPPKSGGESPFFKRLSAEMGLTPTIAKLDPVVVTGLGAYPISVAALGFIETKMPSFSAALDEAFEGAESQAEIDQKRSSLSGHLRKLMASKRRAVSDLESALADGKLADKMQRSGELLLAYGHAIPSKAHAFTATDYDGGAFTIKLDPEQDFKANAQRYFAKAKRAKQARPEREQRHARLREELADIEAASEAVDTAKTPKALDDLLDLCRKKRWLNEQIPVAAKKEDRLYEGHKIRELFDPLGVRILYGENATSNDYLTTRVARPDDWWLHVRGASSAHVVIDSNKQPDKIRPETLEFAARIAARNSTLKHSGYVEVAYVQKRHVRKPRGAAPGSVTMTNEKTIRLFMDE